MRTIGLNSSFQKSTNFQTFCKPNKIKRSKKVLRCKLHANVFIDVVYLITLSLAEVTLYQMIQDDNRIVNWKEYGRKGLWPNSNYCTDIRM
jgi:hypothetical protein